MKAKLNPEEIGIGILQAVCWSFFSGVWSIVTIPLSGLLWAMGGATGYDKNLRRIGVPLVICGLCALNKWSWIPLISILPFWGCNTIGYGVPSWNGPGGTMDDEGAPLGRFWYKIFNNGVITPNPIAENKADLFTRITVGVVTAASMISLVFLNTPFWVIGAIVLIVVYPIICKLL